MCLPGSVVCPLLTELMGVDQKQEVSGTRTGKEVVRPVRWVFDVEAPVEEAAPLPTRATQTTCMSHTRIARPSARNRLVRPSMCRLDPGAKHVNRRAGLENLSHRRGPASSPVLSFDLVNDDRTVSIARTDTPERGQGVFKSFLYAIVPASRWCVPL